MHANERFIQPPTHWELGHGYLWRFRPTGPNVPEFRVCLTPEGTRQPNHDHPHGACDSCEGWGPAGYICWNPLCLPPLSCTADPEDSDEDSYQESLPPFGRDFHYYKQELF